VAEGNCPISSWKRITCLLKYVGTEDASANNSNQRNTFGVGYGTADLYRRRVTRALCSLSSQYVKWPDEIARKKISKSIESIYNFPHCVGIADGTLFPLVFEPQTEDTPDYSGRKYGYSYRQWWCVITREE
jgi:hypothetical protein